MPLRLYDTMKPQGDFPAVEAEDVLMPDGTRLSDFEGGGGTDGVVDQTYNPESENAQSGKALVPILQSKIGIWQPNTEYKVGDVCYAVYIADGYSGHSVFLKCKNDHTSHEYGDPLLDLGNWNVLEITANRSVHDTWGKVIHETYATKKELAEALENIPTGEGGTVTVDQIYNPTSENAQSGKALVPILQSKIGYWQTDTKYKKDDLVLFEYPSNSGDNQNPASVLFLYKCEQDHTSTDWNQDNSYWNRKEITVSGATKDDLGRYIVSTYATKEEIGNINTILESLI